MNKAELLYTGTPETLPASDAAALCNRLGLLPFEVLDWCGAVAEMLEVCCGCVTVIIKPRVACPTCAKLALEAKRVRQVAIEPPPVVRQSALQRSLMARVC